MKLLTGTNPEDDKKATRPCRSKDRHYH